MNKQNKKAFTIVELVIVIAVIAILAAVLIPTFSNLIEKANESRDISLVKNLNTALVLEEVNNTKNSTLHDALNDTLKHGYTVEKLTPTSSGDILWDEVNNKFALVKNDSLLYGLDVTKEVIAKQSEKLWKITNNVDEVTNENAKYSYYLLDSFEGELNVYTGIDVGNNKDVDKVNYTGKDKARNITFRTNGGTLKINGYVNESDENDGDTVNHYGEGNSIEIIKVATKSYHEFGSVLGNIKINKGRVVLENNSLVSAVVITPENNAKVVVKSNGGQVNSIATTNTENVSIEEISLTLETIDQNKVTEMNLFSGGLGTKESPYLVETEEQFTKIPYDSTKEVFIKLVNDIKFTKYNGTGDYYIIKSFKGEIDGDGHKIIFPKHHTSNTVWNALINESKGATIKNINVYYEGIDESCPNDQSWCNLVSIVSNNTIFENINIYNFENTTLNILSNNYGLLASYCEADVTVKNCNNYANAVCTSTGGVGVWFGVLASSKINKFINVNNYGNIAGQSIGYLMGNHGNSIFDQTLITNYTIEEIQKHFVVENCYNYAVIATVVGNKPHFIGYANEDFSDAFKVWEENLHSEFNKVANAQFTKITHNQSFTHTVDENNMISITKPDDSKYVSYKISYNTMYKSTTDDNHGAFSLSVSFDDNNNYVCLFDNLLEGETLSGEGYTEMYSVTSENSSNNFGYSVCTKDDKVYYVFKDINIPNIDEVALFNNVSITIFAYDANGSIVDYIKVK